MQDNIIRFAHLFQGLSIGYQQINFNVAQTEAKKYSTEVKCIKRQITQNDFAAHLTGQMGAGIYPLNEQSKCWFGAIDVDDYSFDHKTIVSAIAKNNLPLIPCRSKSGGMHLYLFCSEACNAHLVKAFLLRCAGILELASHVEFRPMTVTYEGGFSMGITLPYYNADKPINYAYDDNGALPFDAFLSLAESKRVTDAQLKDLPRFVEKDGDVMYQAPPCLQRLYKEGVPVSSRNKAMFNFGIYAKMRFGDEHVENKLHEYNKTILDSPLTDKEITTLTNSINRKTYFYSCSQEPICSRCSKEVCRTRQFGVGFALSDGASKDILIDSIIKFESDDPIYCVVINGKELKLTADQLLSHTQFSKAIFRAFDFVYQTTKKRHEAFINAALEKVKKISLYEDAGDKATFEAYLNAFFDQIPAAKTRREILAGYLWYENGYVYFRTEALTDFFDQKRYTVKRTDIFVYLRKFTDEESASGVLRVDGKVERVIKLKREAPLEDDVSSEIGF